MTLTPDRIGYQRDLAMARLALDDRVGYGNACERMIELALATEDRGAAQMTALACVLAANTVPQWDVVIRLAARAAKGYDGDYRIHVAALWRAGRLAEALELPVEQGHQVHPHRLGVALSVHAAPSSRPPRGSPLDPGGRIYGDRPHGSGDAA